MERSEIAKQSLHFSKVTFYNAFNAMLLLQEQVQRMVDIYFHQMLVFPEEGKRVAEFRHVGAQVQMASEAGEAKTFYVTSIEDGKLTVDGNHPLAGQTATCVVNILEIREATADELKSGMAADSAPPQLH